jgi:TetR/AcrR family transcriptional regulator, cholesterol catabolism regulator
LGVNPRARRIVDTAIDLAEKGGFEAVRLRDVAAEADVALGTLYRYFRSKEDMLIAALNSEVESLEARIQARPMSGDTSLARVDAFFRAATKGLMRRPRLARAILRAAASGDHELAEKVAAFHSRMSAMILAAMHGEPVAPVSTANGNRAAEGAAPGSRAADDAPAGDHAAANVRVAADDEIAVAGILQHIWFSCLIGWAGGLMNQNEVIDRMGSATALLIRATQAE